MKAVEVGTHGVLVVLTRLTLYAVWVVLTLSLSVNAFVIGWRIVCVCRPPSRQMKGQFRLDFSDPAVVRFPVLTLVSQKKKIQKFDLKIKILQ